MKLTAASTVTLLAIAGVGGVFAYQAAARERDYRLHLRAGDAARRDDQTFTAIQEYSGAIALRPDSMLPHLRRGEVYRRRDELDLAAQDFRVASSLDPSAPRPLEELGDVRYQQERFAAAVSAYESRLRLDDRSDEVTYKLALARYRVQDVDNALSAVAQALKLNPRLPEAHYLNGLLLRETAQLSTAQQELERAVALSPGMIAAREELADLYALMSRRNDELEQLQLIAGLDGRQAERHVAVGLAHARAGHGELAVLALGNALERASEASILYGVLGEVWLEMASTRADAMGKALEALGRAAEAPDASSHVLATYGRALLKDNQVDLAERVLSDAIERFPVDPSAFLEHAAAAERQNHLAAARHSLIAYGALTGTNRDFIGLALRIAALSLRLGDLSSAARWTTRAAAAGPTEPRHLAVLADLQLKISAGPQTPRR